MLPQRRLGANGPWVSAIGYGAMAIAPRIYGETTDEEALQTIQHALDFGITFIDTADIYGGGISEQLVGTSITGHRRRCDLGDQVRRRGRDRQRSPGIHSAGDRSESRTFRHRLR